MGNYNPNRPIVLGNEWVGISYEPYPFDIETERGHTFKLDTSTTVVTGAFYVDSLPGNILTYASPMISIYNAGDEANTGPVRKLVIPASGGSNISGTVNIENASSIAEAVATAGDNRYLMYDLADIEHSILFDVGSYSTQLSGKRILNYAFLYSAVGVPPDGENLFLNFELRGTGSTSEINFSAGLEVAPEATITPKISRIDLGNTNMFTTSNLLEPRKFPMRYQDLQRLAPSGSPQISAVIDSAGYHSGTVVYLTYAGLEVTYCDENRIAYGGRSPYPAGSASNYWPLALDQNIVHIRSVSAFTPGVTLSPGEYTVTLTLGAFSPEFDAGGRPLLNALRQLYALPTHKGVQVVRTLQPGQVPRKTEIDVLPQITLHTASAVVTGVHGYGRLVSSPVYDGVNLTQTLPQQSGGTNVPYPYIRFYARRFGDTNVPLKVAESIVGGTASITPEQFDALPEIIAGWREVTLTLSSPSLISNTSNPFIITWSATNLNVGSAWEVLTVDAPGGGVANALQIVNTTYAGSNSITWNGVGDASADAVVMLSQEPFEITDLDVTEESQTLTSVPALDCIETHCVPTAITYNRLTWSIANTVCDSFSDRTTTSTWSDAEVGGTWLNTGGTNDDYYVSDNVGYHQQNNDGEGHISYIDTGTDDGETRAVFTLPVTPTDANISLRVIRRFSDALNFYEAQMMIDTQDRITLQLRKRVAGSESTITTAPTSYVMRASHTPGTRWEVAFSTFGNQLRAKAWRPEFDSEPGWQVTGTDASLTTGTYVGVGSRRESGNTNLFLLISWHSVSSAPFPLEGVGVELQRMDVEDADWQTIMKSSGICPQSFNDYEARVGEITSYRIRSFHIHDFYGSWSGSVDTTLSDPGVVGAEDGNSVLIFTSNERQDGSSNLAYIMTWDSAVSEDFSFPEADTTELRALYGRDYAIAFRPTERGGLTFSRTLLVNNVGISPLRVDDGFRSLRDMAWDDISYVCVRNELGDRWFSNVRVPSGKITRNRRLFVARVDITQVTDTPTQVNPSE